MEGCSFVAGISEFVQDQIAVREKRFGKSPKTDRELAIIHGNCPWVVLRSGVNAPENDNDRRTVFPRTEPERCKVTSRWAKETVLGGELQNRNPDSGRSVRPQGIQTLRNNYNLTNPAYTISAYQGHRPAMGITEVRVTTQDEWGMILEAEIKIKCWSVDDLENLDRVYFKPGYSAILEWGHTAYFREDDTECTTPSQMISDETFFAGGIYQDLDAQVLKRRKEDSNRETLFGYITNFSYSLNKDGSYDCTVKMLSKGSVIRGLKIKGTSQWSGEDSEFQGKDDEKKQDYQMISTWHRMHQAFIDFVESDVKRTRIEATDKSGYSEEDIEKYTTLPSHTELNIKRKDNFFDGKQAFLEKITQETVDKKQKTLPKDEYFSMDFISKLESFPVIALPMKLSRIFGNTRENRKNHEFYITLRSLLQLANVFQSEGNRIGFNLWDNSTYVDPESYVDPKNSDYDTPNPSLNPFVAVKPGQGDVQEFNLIEGSENLFRKLLLEKDKGPSRILDIWINFDMFLLDIEHQIRGQVENYNFFEALKSLLGRIQKAFGNINEFQIVADHKVKDNLFAIIDSKCIYVNTPEEVPEIQVTGLNNTITELKVNSEVSSDLANTMCIAAQAPRTYEESAENVDESLVHWGENCRDRWRLPENKTKTVTDSTTQDQTKQTAEEEERYRKGKVKWKKTLIKNYKSIRKGSLRVDRVDGEQTNESKASEAVLAISEDKFLSLQLDGEAYIRELAAREVPCSQKPGLQMGIIPITVGITMMGIGNLTIGNVFRIKSSVIPKKYKDWGYIVTGIEHHINRSGWTTTLKTQYYPIYYGDNTKQLNTGTNSSIGLMEIDKTGIDCTRQNREALENDCGLYKVFTQDTGFDFNNPRTGGGYMGWCAWYTYGWADAYVNGKKNLRKGSRLNKHDSPKYQKKDYNEGVGTRGPVVSAGGNANDARYWNKLRDLGYRQGTTVKLSDSALAAVRGGSSVGGNTVKKGDVIVIYNGSSYHTAFWTGEKWVSDTDQKSANCYSSGGPWNVIIFSSPAQHPDWNCSA